MASRLSLGSSAAAFTAVAVLAGGAFAGAPNFTMTWDASNDTVGPNTYNWNQFGNLNGFGDWSVGSGPLHSGPWTGWSYDGTLAGPLGLWDLTWNCVFNPGEGTVAAGQGAFVTANIVVTNNDIVNQQFNLLMSLPLLRAVTNPLERGSIVGTVTDLNLNDATVSAPNGSQIYTPRIDGVDEAPGVLMAAPFSTSAGGALLSSIVGPQSFGTPVPIGASQDADSSIAINLAFVLTPGDSASFTAIFEILPVPGPGGLAVLGLMGLVGGRRRRR